MYLRASTGCAYRLTASKKRIGRIRPMREKPLLFHGFCGKKGWPFFT
jgi:hypothetical protein